MVLRSQSLTAAGVCVILCLAVGTIRCAQADGIEEPPDSKVHVLNWRNIDRFLKRNPLVLLEFYAPWCGHCQHLAPQFREAAKKLHEADLPQPVVLAKMDDADDANHNRFRAGAEEMFNFTSYPSLFVVKNGQYGGGWPSKGGKHEWYGGGREADEIVFHMSAVARGQDPYDEEKKLRPGLYKKDDDYDPRVVHDLVPEEFDDVVLNDNKYVWIVEFYSDRCPFCKSLAPEIKKASRAVEEQIPGKTRFGAINSRVFEKIAERFEVTGWPWVTSFHKGEKVEDMAGLGGAESVINWAKKIVDMSNPEGGVSRLSPDFELPPPPPAPGASVSVEVSADGTASSPPMTDRAKLDALIERAKSFNVLTKKKADKIAGKLSDGSSSIAKELKKLQKKMKPLEDALAAASSTSGGSSSHSGAGSEDKMGATDQALHILGGIASRYPQHPTRADKLSLRGVVAGLGQLLPCSSSCRNRFQQALRSPQVGAPRASTRVDVTKWVCRLGNSLGRHDDCDNVKGLAERFKSEERAADAVSEGDIEIHGPWDAILFAKDPDMLAMVKTLTESWEAQELEELESVAEKYNLATSKKLASMRKQLKSGAISQEDHMKRLTKRVAPVLALIKEVEELKQKVGSD